MSKVSAEERAERRRKQAELAEELKSTGALDEVFARIDAGKSMPALDPVSRPKRRLRSGG